MESMERKNSDYHKGYRDGFIEGQSIANEQLAKIISMLPMPPLKVTSEDAKRIFDFLEKPKKINQQKEIG